MFLLGGPTTVQTLNRRLDFVHEFAGYRAIGRQIPERAVAYNEADVRDFYRETGLEIRKPIQYRSRGGHMMQDTIIAAKPGEAVERLDF